MHRENSIDLLFRCRDLAEGILVYLLEDLTELQDVMAKVTPGTNLVLFDNHPYESSSSSSSSSSDSSESSSSESSES
jgi:hypothetical protein